MVGGTVASQAARSPLRSQCKDTFTTIGLVSQPAGLYSYRPGDVTFPVPITSYRSGAGYVRAMNQGGVQVPDAYPEWLDPFATGDTGHPYSKQEYLKVYSNLQSGPRSTTPCSPLRSGSRGAILCALYPTSSGLGNYLTQGISPINRSTPPWAITDSHLEDLGQDFVLDYDPIRVKTDLLQDVGDILREGLPGFLVKTLLKPSIFGRPEIIKRVAGEYLTYLFGVKPIISDIRAILKAANDIDLLINEWIRNNKRQVRRRRQFPVKVTNSYDLFKEGSVSGTVSFDSYLPLSHPWSPSNTPSPLQPYKNEGAVSNYSGIGYRVSKMSVLKEKLRFSAAYEYNLERLLPGPDSAILHTYSNSDLKELIRLHYLGITSSGGSANLIWELTPWSWVIDWFVNIGKMFDYERQVQSVGLHVDYAYVTYVGEKWFKIRSELFASSTLTESNLCFRHDMEFKQLYVRRLKATPFGFKVHWNGLSAQQLVILGALALSRLPL